MESEGEPSRRSAVWNYFTKKGDFVASCNFCQKDYSFRTSVSNLRKHWQNKHLKPRKHIDDDTTDCSDVDWSIHSDDTKNTNKVENESIEKPKSTWQYFEITDSDKFVAKCKVCDKDVSYDSMSDLAEHVKDHDVAISDDEPTIQPKKKGRVNKSVVWQYMKVVGDGRTATCMLCSKQLSYMSSISNLKKHLRRAHPRVNLDDAEDSDTKKLIISANGQLYEIETSDGEKDPIKTDTVFLDDAENGDIFNSFKSQTPLKKINKTDKKRTAFVKNMYKNNADNNSSDEDTPKKTPTSKKGSLDYFGEYIMSLLKELPQHVSDQLQGEIIKQIITAKVAVQSPTYPLTEKPITVTVNKDNKNMPEITIHNTNDVIMMENIDERNENSK